MVTTTRGDDQAQDPAAVPRRRTLLRRRWLSPRALLLHAEVLVIAPGCIVAAWWQATRALGGNELSWVYSVEWPVFALLAIGGWWHLVHEDPEVYRARRRRPVDEPAPASDVADRPRVEPVTLGWTTALAVGVGTELLVGVAAVVTVPFSRPSGWLPSKGEPVYLVHAALGALLCVAALAFLVHSRTLSRSSRLVGWMGAACVAVAGTGGLLTEAQSLLRFFGFSLMLVGSLLALCAYLVPVALNARRLSDAAAERPPVEETAAS
jgi:hypothetical protein